MSDKSTIDNYQIDNGMVRAGEAADAIDGVLPAKVVEPETPEALAKTLAWATRERLSVVLRGNGTKLGWGRPVPHVDLLVRTGRLNRLVAHQHGDLTVAVEAGATIAELNRELMRHGQWLPLDVCADEATIGGTIATNDSGPLRHRHGSARDLLIGVHLALADGRLVKAGGNVVKNVAGYDLGKLMSGSFGGLAAIVSATFKLAPLPSASSTLLAAFRDKDALTSAVTAIRSSQLEPSAFDVQGVLRAPSAMSTAAAYQMLLQFASTSEAVAAQVEAARKLLPADQITVVSGGAEAELWSSHRDLAWAPGGIVLRISWLLAALPTVLASIEEISRSGAQVDLIGRAGVGAGFVRVDGNEAVQIDAVRRLRAAPTDIGNVVVLRAATTVKEKVDVWGMPASTSNLLRSVKEALDPAGILNAGRGPI
jgi:glycolate oxidase FAD binding subunit